jgi:hypothetical protein
MRATLKVKAEHDGLGRQPMRQTRRQSLPLLQTQQTRDDHQNGESRHEQD